MPRVLWFLLLLLLLSLAAIASGADTAPTPRQNCPDKCGNVSIPYPFGIGTECSRPGPNNFAVRCDNDTIPYIGNMQIAGITLEAGEMRVYARTVTYVCLNASGNFSTHNMNVELINSPYLVSAERNVFTAVGCNAVAKIVGGAESGESTYRTGCITYCASVEEAQPDDEPCSGLGCCEAPITAGLSIVNVSWGNGNNGRDPEWRYNPCRYAMVAEKGWYGFKRKDLDDYLSLANRVGTVKVPLVLDWAIRNATCPTTSEAITDNNSSSSYACVSNHSYCVNTNNGKGYFCNCSQGYSGNPYLPDGCTNIDECHLRKVDPNKYEKLYPCNGGICHDIEGDYECKCKFGEKGHGKSIMGCQSKLSREAVAAIGTICSISFVIVISLFIWMMHNKRTLMKSFNKNGGELLKKVGIRIFSKNELDKITENYGYLVGKGGFGEVYKGTIIDNNHQQQEVVVKRSYTIDESRKEDFANEVSIQCQIKHKNIVRLLGCCLETDVPMLVYEYVPRGSLYDVLHGEGGGGKDVSNSKKHILTLSERLDIAIYSAEALVYIHSYLNECILHGDIKSANILVNKDFLPKVSDFGISRVLSPEKQHTMLVRGDCSYIDPAFMKTGILTEKSDVYSFGIVLLELITGKEARYGGNHSLPIDFVKSYKAKKARDEMFDKMLASNDIAVVCLEKVGGIALDCLEDDVDKRPFMKEVLSHLIEVKTECIPKTISSAI